MLKKLNIMGMVVLFMGIFATAASAATPPLQEGEGQEYVVQTDDWLSSLAEKYLGDSDQWNLIVEATNGMASVNDRITPIEDPNIIYPGQVIIIPTTEATVVVEGQEVGVETGGIATLCNDQHPAVQTFCSEIPVARVHFDPNEEVEYFTCAGRFGLASVQVDQSTPVTVLVPNDGDFDLAGIAAAVKVTTDGAYLIPRWPDSLFDFSEEFAQTFSLPEGDQLEIPLAATSGLIKEGALVWTGEYGNSGRAGLFQTDPVLTCDPQADFEVVVNPFIPEESGTETEE